MKPLICALVVSLSASHALSQGETPLLAVHQLPATGASDDLDHLPEIIQRDIMRWRERLEEARSLKVVVNLEETWSKMHELDDRGTPIVTHRERFEVHSWMTPDMVWMVIFPYIEEAHGKEVVDTDTAHYEQLWHADTGTVWLREWLPEEKTYRVRRYTIDEPAGPIDGTFYSWGCIYATVMGSWLAGDGPLVAARSLTLTRQPNLAIVPPDPSTDGVWLDVFKDEMVRDTEPSEEELYRRRDLMLLARNDAGEPEVREWRTIVLSDPNHGGKEPQDITATRRLSYTFYDQMPSELLEVTRAFARDVDAIIDDEQAAIDVPNEAAPVVDSKN